ncbi:MAG TPA: creatininase family protein [Planctomycetota bacterium]|nr:creatininase family protein [Planctomycetota bacterium]
MTEWAKCTWTETRELLSDKVVALVPVGCTEPHGPHLPLDTDVTIAQAQARRAAELFAGAGVRALVLPAVAYGVTNYTEGFAGRLTIRPGTLWALLEDVIEALEQEGVRQIVLVNGHLEPAHVAVLRGVVLDHAQRSPLQAQAILADTTRRRWAATLGLEFQSGDCHAGRYETSIVLHADPAHVRASQRELASVSIGLLSKMKAGVTTFKAAGAGDAYCGAPAEASVEEGRRLVDALALVVVESARETWPDLFA